MKFSNWNSNEIVKLKFQSSCQITKEMSCQIRQEWGNDPINRKPSIKQMNLSQEEKNGFINRKPCIAQINPSQEEKRSLDLRKKL